MAFACCNGGPAKSDILHLVEVLKTPWVHFSNLHSLKKPNTSINQLNSAINYLLNLCVFFIFDKSFYRILIKSTNDKGVFKGADLILNL